MKMVFKFEMLSFNKDQRAAYWLLLILGHVSYSHGICTNGESYMCHPDDPSKFYQCTGYGRVEEKTCSGSLHFDLRYNICNWPNKNDCGASLHDSSKTTKLNDVGTATKPITKSVVTTDVVPSKLSSLVSKIYPASTSKPLYPSETTSKQNTGSCHPENCKLPNCKCPGPEIPDSLSPSSTPQIILLTFDDGINTNNIKFYRELFGSNITNPNGCPINATFFVSGDAVNPEYVKELHRHGHEIASHSMTHKFPIGYWLNGDYKTYVDEIVGMRTFLNVNARIPLEDIRGMRSPFLAMGGDRQFEVLRDDGFQYDSSMVTGSFSESTEEPAWPFTLDYPVNDKYCALTICPKKSYPGLWEVPLIRWYNDEGKPCAMPDACSISKDSSAVVKYLKDNFNRHYKRNKAPLGIFLHATWLTDNLNPLKTFLKEVSMKEDVWIVSVFQALQWIQNPVPLNKISEFKSWNCK